MRVNDAEARLSAVRATWAFACVNVRVWWSSDFPSRRSNLAFRMGANLDDRIISIRRRTSNSVSIKYSNLLRPFVGTVPCIRFARLAAGLEPRNALPGMCRDSPHSSVPPLIRERIIQPRSWSPCSNPNNLPDVRWIEKVRFVANKCDPSSP